MKQFKTISMLAFLLTAFSVAEMAAQQNWRLGLTTDYQVSLDNKIDYWDEVLGDDYSYLRSHKKQKSSVILTSDYHFLTQKPVGFFIGTGVGYRKYGAFDRSRASFESVHLFSLHNVIVPWRIGLDIRPNDKLTINVSATYEHMFPAAGRDRVGTSLSSEELSNGEYILGEISDNVSSISYGIQNQGGMAGSLDVGFDIEIYKNYHLFIGTGIGVSFNRYETSYSIGRFSSATGEPDADSTYFPSSSGNNTYDFISLKTGITKTF